VRCIARASLGARTASFSFTVSHLDLVFRPYKREKVATVPARSLGWPASVQKSNTARAAAFASAFAGLCWRMSQDEEYRRQAAECRRMAENARSPLDKDAWLRLADSWLQMLPLSAKLLTNGTLRTYKGFPHGMPTTEADTINADLLAFITG
jgi:hypothetical protein